MDFSTIATTWAALTKTSKLLILTETERYPIAEKIVSDNLAYVSEAEIIDIGTDSTYQAAIHRLTSEDLLLVLLTTHGYMRKGYRDTFSLFQKPFGCACKYIFIRLDISEASLLSGLNTGIDKVTSIVRGYQALGSGQKVHITNDKGTDITTQIVRQYVLPFSAQSLGGHAILPPSEIYHELEPASTNGIIAVDITVGEIRFNADLIDPLGIVDQTVMITVQNGLVSKIEGGEIAQRLKAGLNKLDKNLQVLVELGIGLSDLSPTGIIGIDESMNGTCHFGIGNHTPYHVDVVLSHPHIVAVDE